MVNVKNKLLGILRLFAPLFKEEKLYGSRNTPPLLPFYHAVSNEDLPHIRHLYAVKGVQQFEKELDYLLSKFRPVGIEELLPEHKDVTKTDKGKPAVHFTFDDGLIQVFQTIAPMLKRKGVPATFFINPHFLDDNDVFYRYKVSLLIAEMSQGKASDSKWTNLKSLLVEQGVYNNNLKSTLLKLEYSDRVLINEAYDVLRNEKQFAKIYLNTKEVTQLIADGFTIGAHSLDHPLYAKLDLQTQKQQTKESIDLLVNQFDLTYRLFAFPFTDYGVPLELFKWIHDEKQPIADLTFGTAGLKASAIPNHYQRLPMERYVQRPKDRIMGEYLYYNLLKTFNRHVVHYR
jgi:peptidoglycan/xylan/chitin deacetylase (PgdA/CDA1 family)